MGLSHFCFPNSLEEGCFFSDFKTGTRNHKHCQGVPAKGSTHAQRLMTLGTHIGIFYDHFLGSQLKTTSVEADSQPTHWQTMATLQKLFSSNASCFNGGEKHTHTFFLHYLELRLCLVPKNLHESVSWLPICKTRRSQWGLVPRRQDYSSHGNSLAVYDRLCRERGCRSMTTVTLIHINQNLNVR